MSKRTGEPTPLCQIAFGYMIWFWVLQMRFRCQVAVGLAMLVGYSTRFAIFSGPAGLWSKTGNIGGVINQEVLGYTLPGAEDNVAPGLLVVPA
jgi:predicted acyltransferase